MPQRPHKPCSRQGCPALTNTRFCPAHKTEHGRLFDVRRGNSNDRGYGATWRRLRALQLLREPLCRKCAEQGFIEEAREVDHIIPKARGGRNDDSNLQSLCKPHHSAKTASEVLHAAR